MVCKNIQKQITRHGNAFDNFMTIANDIEWHRHSRLPACVKLHYLAPDGLHPLTLTEVRERYTRDVADSSLVVWRSSSTGRFGFRAGIDELTWEVQRVSKIEFVFCYPAKGPGNILLCIHEEPPAKTEIALSSGLFDPELLDWFRPILAILIKMFPQRVVERDNGPDG